MRTPEESFILSCGWHYAAAVAQRMDDPYAFGQFIVLRCLLRSHSPDFDPYLRQRLGEHMAAALRMYRIPMFLPKISAPAQNPASCKENELSGAAT